MPGFGFMGSDSTKWTMMVPMVTVKKEPEECMESVHGCQSVLGGRDTDEDLKTEVKVEPADPETGIKLMGNGVESDWMLAMSCGDGEDELDSVQVKEEPVSDEELSQTAVGNMVYIHKSSQDIFDEHERQPPETQEQLVSLGTVGSLKHVDEEQQVPQQYSLAKEKSVKQQLVAKLKIIRQQRELAKQQSEKQQPIAKLKTVKQQLLAKRQLAKHQRLGLMPEPVKEEPPTEKLQPKEKKQQETPQPAVEQLTAKQPWIKIQPKPQTVESSLSVTNEQSLVMRHEQPRIQMHPLIKLQQAAQQQPMVKLKAMAQQQPVVKPQAVTQQQMMVKLKKTTNGGTTQQQPVVKHQAARQLQMMVKLKAVEKQPIVKLQEATQQQPVVKLQAETQQQLMVKLKAVEKEPMVKLQEALPNSNQW
ncbi:putative mediator of RNA polymerase II transcription subunit 12 [Haliotis rubra]|uniref:putative mediator of RNA polymerase II transcription subunit 12 n=1 Tax=Haliotis rubra TaxID=36100 RepID=UPI001EE58B62|nr:putative mediator of RNA polymerase II transcription subunit 12 [Haliotis rubra]